jgi:hypothetical protein
MPKICVLFISVPYGGGDSVEAPMRRQRTVVPRPTQKLPSQKIGSSVFDSTGLPTEQKENTYKKDTGEIVVWNYFLISIVQEAGL